MTATLTITTGTRVHEFPLPTGEGWTHLYWSANDFSLDVSCFMRRVGELTEVEIGIGNVSIVPGDASKTKPRMQASVALQAPDGRELFGGRSGSFWQDIWPTDWPIGRETWRRYVIATAEKKRAATVLADGAFSPTWRERSKVDGPCNLPMPRQGDAQRVLILDQDRASYALVRAQVAAGQPFHVEDYSDGVLHPYAGWMPHGPSDDGEVGGSGIYLGPHGHRQNRADLKRAYILAQCEHDRMRRYYVRDTGEPVSTEHYPGQDPDVYGLGDIPEVMIQDGGGDPLPKQYDSAHLIRGFRRTLQVAEQADSPMAKRAIAGVAAFQRLRYAIHGRLGQPGYYPNNLAALQQYADLAPHTGIFGSVMGRQLGWPAFVVACDLKLNGIHGENADWARALLTVVQTATMPNGAVQKSIGGSGGWPSTFYSMQSFEAGLLAFGLVGLARQTPDTVPDFVHRIGEAIYGPETKCPILPYTSSYSVGPQHYLKVAEADGTLVPELKDGAGPGDPAHATAMCALQASLATRPGAWIERGTHYGVPFPDVASKLSYLMSTNQTDMNGDAAWIGVAQKETA